MKADKPSPAIKQVFTLLFCQEENPLEIMLRTILFCLPFSKYDPNLEKKGENFN